MERLPGWVWAHDQGVGDGNDLVHGQIVSSACRRTASELVAW